MEKEIIQSCVSVLPESKLGSDLDDGEIWEGVDGEACFRITRPFLPTADGVGIGIISMNISGPPDERARLISEFSEVYGEPVTHDVHPDGYYCVDVAAWLFVEK